MSVLSNIDGNSLLSNSVSQRLRQDVKSMHAYAIQDASGMVKLDAMENPYTLPLHLQQALGARLGAAAINRYPGARVEELKRALMAYAQVPSGFGIVLGNGSDELISLLAMACDVPQNPTQNGPKDASTAHGGESPAAPVVMAPVPGFVMYAMSAQFQGLQFVGVPLTADFELDVPAMQAAIAQHRPAITYLAYPNNPTANAWPLADVEAVIAACAQVGGLVVMDEAYQPFASGTYMQRAASHSHVLVMRTLSKFGLAGVRIGYLVGPAALVAEVDKLRPPYNVGVLNAECALFALENADEFAQQAARIKASREQLLAELALLPGLQVFKSQANMVLVRVLTQRNANNGGSPAGSTGEPSTSGRADAVFASLKTQKILVKNVSKMHPLLSNCLRLTVGTPDENRQMLAALTQAL